jgi:hypothetical protein
MVKEGMAARKYGSRSSERSSDFPDAEELYLRLEKVWRDIDFDPKSGKGRARVGNIGIVEFHESGSDPAVVVSLPALRFKTRGDDAMRIISAISKIMDV